MPYSIWHEANFHLQVDSLKYTVIAAKLKTEPIIAALLDNFSIMFACGDIQVEPKVTKAIERFVDIVSGDDNHLKDYCDVAYKIKSEFEKYFEVSKEELEKARALEESRMQGLSKSTWKEK